MKSNQIRTNSFQENPSNVVRRKSVSKRVWNLTYPYPSFYCKNYQGRQPERWCANIDLDIFLASDPMDPPMMWSLDPSILTVIGAECMCCENVVITSKFLWWSDAILHDVTNSLNILMFQKKCRL